MKKHTTKLIDGNFKRDKAKKLLIDLVSRKINYHETVKFSNEERLGKDPDFSEKRIQELKKEKEELTEWLDGLKKSATIQIKSNITLEIID